MTDFFECRGGCWWYRHGASLTEARLAAGACQGFVPDDEDEQVDDVPLSCVNCAWRRWEQGSFQCLYLKRIHPDNSL